MFVTKHAVQADLSDVGLEVKMDATDKCELESFAKQV